MSLGGGLAQAFVRLRVDSSVVAADTSKGIEEGAAAADVESAGASAGERASSAFNKAFKAGMIGVLAAAAIGAVAIKSAIDFQTQMTKIQTQAGASAAQVKQLSAAVLQLAPSTQQGPMQLAESLYHLKSVGLDNAQAMMALKTASDLAAVGGSNLEETTNAIAAAWRSGIKGAQNFTAAASTVNAIIGAGNMRMQDFVAAMSTGVLSAATTFGVSLKQVGGAMALMVDEGVPAQLASTRLRMSLSLLGAASPTAAKQLKTIGLTSYQLGQELRTGGFIGAIGLLRQHLKGAGLDATQTAALLSHAFGGGQSSSAILTLINNFDTLKKKQDQIDAGMSKYGADVAAQRQTIQAQLDILRSTLETAGIRMGQALLPPFTRLVKFLASDLLPAAIRLGGVLGHLFQNPFVDAFVGALLAAGLAIKGIIIVTKLWEGAQLLLDAAMDANPVGIIIVAVAALAAGIAVLWERSSAFRKVVEGAFHGVLAAARDVWNWIKGHWMLLAAILVAPILPAVAIMAGLFLLLRKPVQKVFDDIKRIITGGFDSWWKGHGKELEQVWHDAWASIKAVFDLLFGPVIQAVKAGWDLITTVISGGVKVAEDLIRIAWGFISATTRATWDLISGVVRAVWDVIAGVVKIAIDGIVSVVKIGWDLLVGIFNVALALLTGHWGKAWNDIKNTATQVWNAIKSWFGTALSDFEHMFSSAWDSLLGGLKSWASDMLGYVRQIPGMILHALGDVGHLLWNAGVSIIKGLIGGIGSMIGSVGHAIGSVVSTIKSFLPFSPAKQGPLSGSGDTYYSGLSVGGHLANGILASIPGIVGAAREAAAAAADAINQAVASGGGILASIPGLSGAVAAMNGTPLKYAPAKSTSADALSAALSAALAGGGAGGGGGGSAGGAGGGGGGGGGGSHLTKLGGKLDKLTAKLDKLKGLGAGKQMADAIRASLPALKAAVKGTAAEITAALAKAAKEKAGGTKDLGSLTSQKGALQAERAKEEAEIKKLIAAREAEYKAYGKASAAERKAQEDEIKELEKLRAKQETQAKQVEAVISTLKKSMTQLKDEVDKLKTALAKAEKAAAKAAAASSSSSSSSSSGSSSSGAQPTDWGNFDQWLAETAPNPADSGSWQGNPGPLGGFGLAFDPGGGPRPVGGFDGGGPFGQGGNEVLVALMAEKMDTMIAAIMAQPAKNAAGMSAAMNGVTGTAITRGNW